MILIFKYTHTERASGRAREREGGRSLRNQKRGKRRKNKKEGKKRKQRDKATVPIAKGRKEGRDKVVLGKSRRKGKKMRVKDNKSLFCK